MEDELSGRDRTESPELHGLALRGRRRRAWEPPHAAAKPAMQRGLAVMARPAAQKKTGFFKMDS